MQNHFSPFLLKSIINLLLTDPEYRDRFFSVLTPENFNVDDKMIYTIARAIWGMHEKYNSFPSVDALAEEIFSQKGKNIGLWPQEPSKEELVALLGFFEEVVNEDITDKKYVEDNTIRILSFLAVQKVIVSNKQDFVNGTLDVEEFAKDIVSCTSFATPVELGINLYENLDKRTEERASTAITPGLIEYNVPYFAKFLEEGGLPPGSLGFFLAPTNGGKCLQTKELVLLYNGKIKEAQNIIVGDKLMGPDSKPRTVLAITKGVGPMYNVIPNTGKVWKCNDKHILTLINTESKNRYKFSLKLRDVINISVEDYLKKSKTFKHKYKLFIPDQIEFLKIKEPEIDPYFLGLWFGDGTKNIYKNHRGISLTTADIEIKNYCNKIALQYNLYLIEHRKKDNKAGTYSLTNKNTNCGIGRSNILLDKFRSLVGENKTIPDCIKYGSIETRLQFLAGFIDTDGHLHHGYYEIIQKRKDYIEDVAFIARSLGLRANYKECIKTIKSIGFSGKYYRLHISGEISKIPVKLERKKHNQLKSRKNGKRTGFKIEPAGIGEYAGFELDGDGKFLLGDFTVTHNSSALIQLTHDAAIKGHSVLYISAELSEDMIKRRFDACMTGIPIHNVKKEAGSVRAAITSSPQFIATAQRIQVVEVPMGVAQPSDIELIVERLKKRGFHTNLLVVDYADNLRSQRKSEQYRLELTSIYRDLRAIAQRQHLVIWTASQMNDAGTEAAEKKGGIITIRHVNEARGKIQIADLCVAVARTQEEKETSLARLILVKNRNGSGDGSVAQVSTRFDISKLFGEEKNVVPMSSIAPDEEIDGLELNNPDDSGDIIIRNYKLGEPSSLKSRYA